MKRIDAWLRRPWVFPLLLLGVMAFTYAYQITRMGFYWVDWQAVFVERLQDRSLFWSYFAYDRPFSAWTYVVMMPLLGTNAIAWQAATILLRWAGILCLWLVLRTVWPRRSFELGWAALLLAVYPGFSQQSIAVAYSQHFTCFALYTFSLWLMVQALRPAASQRRFVLLTLLAALTSLMHLLTMEYFAGMELARPLLLWLLLCDRRQNWRQNLGRTLRAWWPYALVLVVFLGLRFAVYPLVFPDPSSNAPLLVMRFGEQPLQALARLAQLVVQDFLRMMVFVWTDTFQPALFDLAAPQTLATMAAGLALAALVAGYFWRYGGEAEEGGDDFVRQALLFGLAAVVLGGLPVWGTDRQSIVGKWSDRFSLGPMIGLIVLLVGAAGWFAPRRRRQMLLFGVLLTFAVGAQMRTVNDYRKSWEEQRSYYWQLNWRAPELKDGTLVLGQKVPNNLISEYSVWFALNVLYAPELRNTQMPYWFLSALNYYENKELDFKPGIPVHYGLRTIAFDGSTSQALVVYSGAGERCLRVMTPEDRLLPGLSREEMALVSISNLDQIVTDEAQGVKPPAEVFGAEPAHGWCYYYQKAELARQRKDWQAAAALGDEARQAELYPRYGVELLPFIEGYGRSGNWDRARAFSIEASQLSEGMQPALCGLWQRMSADTADDAARVQAQQALETALSCATVKH